MARLLSFLWPVLAGDQSRDGVESHSGSGDAHPTTGDPSDTLPTHQRHIRPGPHPPQLPPSLRTNNHRPNRHRPPSTLITIEEIDSNYGSSSSVTGCGSPQEGEFGRNGPESGPRTGSMRGSSGLSMPEVSSADDEEVGADEGMEEGDVGVEQEGKEQRSKAKGKERAVDPEELNLSGLSSESQPDPHLPDPHGANLSSNIDPAQTPKQSIQTPDNPKTPRTRHIDRELTPKRGRGLGRPTNPSNGYGMGTKRSPDTTQVSKLLLELGEETVKGFPSDEATIEPEVEEEEVLIITGHGRRRGSVGDWSEGDDRSIRSQGSFGSRRGSRSIRSLEGERSLEVIARRVDRLGKQKPVGRPGSNGVTSNSPVGKKVTSPTSIPDLIPSAPLPPLLPFHQRPLFIAGLKLALLFSIFTAVLLGTLWFGIPPLEGEDRGKLRLPRSFADLKGLTGLFQKYKSLYPFSLCSVGIVGYLYVQTFSLPGSMYISILFGAAYGMFYGLLLSCLCEATGALFCYSLSAALGPPLLEIPAYRSRLETWRTKIMGDKTKGEAVGWDGVFAFLIVLRIAPFPPHWITNVVAPHLDIFPLLFWSACFIGIGPVSVIHVTIGSGLDQMTSAEDFHILSLRNVLGLIGVGVAVMIPVGLKRVFKKDLSNLNEAEDLLLQPDIHVHPPSSTDADAVYDCESEEDGRGFSPSSSRNLRDLEDGYGSGDVLDGFLYQGQENEAGPSRGHHGHRHGHGHGRTGSHSPYKLHNGHRNNHPASNRMDLETTLDLIRDARDEEVLAVVYADETGGEVGGEIIEGLYKGGVGRVVDGEYEYESEEEVEGRSDVGGKSFLADERGEGYWEDGNGGEGEEEELLTRSIGSLAGNRSLRRGYGTIGDDDDQDGDGESRRTETDADAEAPRESRNGNVGQEGQRPWWAIWRSAG